LVYVLLHKPRGVMCTLSDPEGRPTIAELLRGVGARVVPVGRLDFHTSGALLCTNDGEFANVLMHPSRGAPKVYVAKVQGHVEDANLRNWEQSIEIDGRSTRPALVRRLRFEGDKTWLELTLREGRNRQVRRLGEATGFLVMRLARISHAGVSAEGLRPGQWRHLSVDELTALKKEFGVPKRIHPPPAAAPPVRASGYASRPANRGQASRSSVSSQRRAPGAERQREAGDRGESRGPKAQGLGVRTQREVAAQRASPAQRTVPTQRTTPARHMTPAKGPRARPAPARKR
jgi:23S rRNA pseudouridine2605 synthase